MEDQSMTTKTKKAPSEATPPLTFGDIARKKMRARIEAYRQFARRAADGEVWDSLTSRCLITLKR